MVRGTNVARLTIVNLLPSAFFLIVWRSSFGQISEYIFLRRGHNYQNRNRRRSTCLPQVSTSMGLQGQKRLSLRSPLRSNPCFFFFHLKFVFYFYIFFCFSGPGCSAQRIASPHPKRASQTHGKPNFRYPTSQRSEVPYQSVLHPSCHCAAATNQGCITTASLAIAFRDAYLPSLPPSLCLTGAANPEAGEVVSEGGWLRLILLRRPKSPWNASDPAHLPQISRSSSLSCFNRSTRQEGQDKGLRSSHPRRLDEHDLVLMQLPQRDAGIAEEPRPSLSQIAKARLALRRVALVSKQVSRSTQAVTGASSRR